MIRIGPPLYASGDPDNYQNCKEMVYWQLESFKPRQAHARQRHSRSQTGHVGACRLFQYGTAGDTTRHEGLCSIDDYNLYLWY